MSKAPLNGRGRAPQSYGSMNAHARPSEMAHGMARGPNVRPASPISIASSSGVGHMYEWQSGTPRTRMNLMDQRRSQLLDEFGGADAVETPAPTHADPRDPKCREWIDLVKNRDKAFRAQFKKECERTKHEALTRLLGQLEGCAHLSFTTSLPEERAIASLVVQLRNLLRRYCTSRGIHVIETDIADAMSTTMGQGGTGPADAPQPSQTPAAAPCPHCSNTAVSHVEAPAPPPMTAPPPPPPPPPAPPVMTPRQPVARKLDVSSAVGENETAVNKENTAPAQKDVAAVKPPMRPHYSGQVGGRATATAFTGAPGRTPHPFRGSFFVENISAASKTGLKKTQFDRSPGGTPARRPRGHNAHLRQGHGNDISPAPKDEGSFLASALRKKFRNTAIHNSPQAPATPLQQKAPAGDAPLELGVENVSAEMCEVVAAAPAVASPSPFDSPYQAAAAVEPAPAVEVPKMTLESQFS